MPFPAHHHAEGAPALCNRVSHVPLLLTATQRVHLLFEAAGSAMYVWVNGNMVGYSQDSMLPAEFDVTEFVRPGANLVACQVMRWSDGTYLEDQDQWWLCGIHRDVAILCLPQTFIQVTTPATHPSLRMTTLPFLPKPLLSPRLPSGLLHQNAPRVFAGHRGRRTQERQAGPGRQRGVLHRLPRGTPPARVPGRGAGEARRDVIVALDDSGGAGA